jgi:nitrous oxidase accessory protein
MAAEGDTVLVPAGVWREHVRVERRVTLRGDGATLDGEGTGTVLTVSAAEAVVEGFVVRGSGSDLGAPDVGIYTTPEATGVVLRRNRIEDCAFGIWVHMSDRAQVLDNTVVGRSHVRVADRGNGIHLFDASFVLVRGNHVSRARDGIYVSATDDSRFVDNVVEDQRYGVHYMYSQRNELRGNVSRRNSGGYALMQSHTLVVEENTASENSGTGILFRDVQYCSIRDNTLDSNGQALFFFSSTENVIRGNRIIHNDIGAKMWAGSLRNDVAHNQFIGNREQIFFVGSDDVVWGADGVGNFWSDYTGWDQDGDGIGDRPYRVDGLTANLLHRFPSAVLLLRSPALELIRHLESRMPILRVPTIVDSSPLMRGGHP